MLYDSFGRLHNYLRISLTDNCNFRCFYCMPNEDHLFTPAARLMQAGEIEALAKIFVRLGVNKIRLTGGEPTVRKDFETIVQALAALPVQLAITTNGTRIHEFPQLFLDGPLRAVNISLDTLQREKFARITRRDAFDRVTQNIELLLQASHLVKVNVVAMQGVNEDEILDFVAWTQNKPVHVRFIEFMPFSGNHWSNKQVLGWQQILQTIGTTYTILPLQNAKHDTAKAYRVPGHAGTFAVISTITAPFCETCNRMRLTADGKLKNCLFSRGEIDLLTPLRAGEDVEQLIHRSLREKAEALGGQFHENLTTTEAAQIENRSMISIGG